MGTISANSEESSSREEEGEEVHGVGVKQGAREAEGFSAGCG